MVNKLSNKKLFSNILNINKISYEKFYLFKMKGNDYEIFLLIAVSLKKNNTKNVYQNLLKND
jgi:hypothetical protein